MRASIVVKVPGVVVGLIHLLAYYLGISNAVHHMHLNASMVAELEKLGELYYDEQKDERFYKVSDDFNRIKPNFPCIYGVIPLGSADRESVVDGHKFACGLHAIVGPPIVYSFGSNQQQDFEEAILRLRPDAQIFVYELKPDHLPPVARRDGRISYNAVGLGGYDSKGGNQDYVLKPMRALMKENNHTYVDVLKMDIEGVEFDWLKSEGPAILPRTGQLLVELHLHFGYVQEKYPSDDTFTFVTECEKYGLRVFNQEVNKLQTIRFTELSLIHHNWLKWNTMKYKFAPLEH